jgi:type IV secretion system protein TrbC
MMPTLKLYKLAPLALLLGAARPALAATGGTSLPWDAGLIALQSNLGGPVATTVVGIGTVVAGFFWIWAQNHSEGGQKFSKILFGGALAVFSLQFLSALGLNGAVL